jgi:glycosyltransferase 2 family protein
VDAIVMLWALDVRVSLTTATIVEALGSAVRFATFLVPASLGPSEAANAATFTALGLGAGAGLAFSLVRRARQVVWIVIGIVVLLVMRGSARRPAPGAARLA